MGMEYEKFISEKAFMDAPSGFEMPDHALTRGGGEYELFPFQTAIVKWALKRGRAAIFADTGLGKTAMQAAWSWSVHQYTGNRVLILAPLCVAPQTVVEAAHFGIPIRYVREMPEAGDTGIFITNYEMIDRFEQAISDGYFDGVVLDESSILKHQDSRTRKRLIDVCSKIPYRLSCTATPSPNDYMELGGQAEFLGVMGTMEMLSMFFIHDSGETSKWRLKGHGRTRFWEWMSHWAVFIKKPSDLGFDDAGYDLPALEIDERAVITGKPVGQSLSERNQARRESIDERVAQCAAIVNASSEPFVVWCNLNEESAKLTAAIPDAVEVKGSDKLELKEERIRAFSEGRARVIITKPSITGYGLNWQHCAQMAFVGLNDSYEDLYQAIRRCYRFGQSKSVRVTLISADSEGAVLENIKRKERQAEEMSLQMINHMRDFCRKEVVELKRERSVYARDIAKGKDWTLHLGDCVDVTRELADESVDYSIFSPPFSSLYTYSNSDRDMGNSKDDSEFFAHFRFLVLELYRVLRSGRNISIHCMNLPTSKQHHGYIGIRDFRGEIIRLFESAGFIFHSEVCIWKDPVVAMQRTKALGLLWKQIKKDSTMSRQGIADHVVTFRKPGENTRPLAHTPEEFPVNLWQELASPCWMDIRQSNTLNRKIAREENDEKHICPLQLDLIERCMFLWSIPGDTVFSPFAGIGSEGYVAAAMGRRFVGSELKRSYFELALNNLANAPRAEYRFPYFSQKIGKWERDGVRVEVKDHKVPAVDADESQMDWLNPASLTHLSGSGVEYENCQS
jgi:DNA modification methylase